MIAVHLGDVPSFLDDPEPTATKRGRQFGAGIDWADPVSPGAGEVAPLERGRAAPDPHAPQWMGGTFGAPIGMRGPQFEALCREQVGRWIEAQRKAGFDIWSGTRIQIDPGPYPRTDLATGLKLMGEREMLVRAQFVERQPEVIRLELPGGLFEPWRPTPRATSGGDEGD